MKWSNPSTGRLKSTALLLLVLALLAAACGGGDQAASDADSDTAGDVDDGASPDDSAAEPKGEVHVGLINPVTGVFAGYGQDANDGFELYLEEHGGQLGGYDVQVSSEDTAADAPVAIEAVDKLINQDEVDVLVGLVHSGVAYAVSTQIQESGVPLIITQAGADNLTQRDAAENIFRVAYTGSQDAMPLGEYACNELGYETVAIISLDYAFGWEAAGGFAKVYEDEGCDVIQEIYVPLGTEDWAPFAQQLDTSADAVWALTAGPDGPRFVQAYRDFGVDLPLIGHGGLTDTNELQQMGSIAEGIVTSHHYAEAIDSDVFRTFAEAFEEQYDRMPSQTAESAYLAAQMIDRALADMDEVDHASLVAALAEVEVDAPRGPVSFDEYGQVVHNIYIREAVPGEQEGRWVNEILHTYDNVSQFWTYDPEEWMEEPLLDTLKGTWAE